MKLIAHMVGRNEADRYLVPVLERLSSFVDEIVFVDDNSTDDTPKIAKKYGAHVGLTPVASGSAWEEHEGEFRMAAWNYLKPFASPGDWVLAIDCDEMLYGHQNIRNLMEQDDYDVLGITFFHMWNEKQYRADKAWHPTVSSRLFRYFEGGTYRNKALACGAEPTYVQDLIRSGRFNPQTGLKMKHLGYQRDEDKQAKHERYMRLDQGNFHSLAHLQSILDKEPKLVDWIWDD